MQHFREITHQRVRTVRRLANEWRGLRWQRVTSQVKTDVRANYDDTESDGQTQILNSMPFTCRFFPQNLTNFTNVQQ